MKDILTLTIAGLTLWWVTSWVDSAYADVVFDNNTAWFYVTLFSF